MAEFDGEYESELAELDQFMDKTVITSSYVRSLVDAEGITINNLFEVDLGPNTTWDYLIKLNTKCDLYHNKGDALRKINKFETISDNELTQSDNELRQIIYEEGGERDNFTLPVDITTGGGRIFRTFRFIDATTEKAHLKIPEGNYVNFKYVKLEPGDEKMLSTNEFLLKKLKSAVNATFHLVRLGKLLAQRNTGDGEVFDAYLPFYKGKDTVNFDVQPIGVLRKFTDAGKNIQKGSEHVVQLGHNIVNTLTKSELTNIDEQQVAADKENKTAGFYADVDPAAFFDQFHLLIRNDNNLFGGKRRTRRSKKSQKNKRKNKKTNKRRRR